MNDQVRSEDITHAPCEQDWVTCTWKVWVRVRRVTKISDEVRFLFNACETTQSCGNAKDIFVAATHVALQGWRDLWRVQASAVGRRCEAEQLIQAASREPKQTTRELQSAMPKKTGGHQNGDAAAAQPNYEQQAIGEDWNSQPEVLTEWPFTGAKRCRLQTNLHFDGIGCCNQWDATVSCGRAVVENAATEDLAV